MKRILNKESRAAIELMIANDLITKDVAEKYFPELKESEDERIRKEILNHLKEASCGKTLVVSTLDYKIWADWFEKQGNKKTHVILPTFTIDDVLALQCCLETVKKVQEDKDLYKQLNNLHSRVYDVYQLEKQGEHANFRNKIQIGDKVTRNEDGILVNLSQLQRVAKPADKVEPKFKVGDWIVNNTTLNLCHIVKVEHGQYICDDCSFPITKENEYHLWTIQDAKDGDVLVTWNNTTFIFKAIEDDVVKYYIAYNEKWDEEIRVPLSNDSHVGLAESQFESKPATKEQRNTLMKAMADAGYTFDFEKKELKKIEQKPAWSEEDEVKINRIVAYLENLNVADNDILLKDVDWLKSLKDRVLPKQEWSEEDEKLMRAAFLFIEAYGHEVFYGSDKEDVLSWLKSLRPQSQWNPSDEQIKAVKEAACYSSVFSEKTIDNLISLTKQLKKLREE